MGLALICTPWSIRNASSPGSTKLGSVVVKEVTGLGASAGGAGGAGAPGFDGSLGFAGSLLGAVFCSVGGG